MLKKTLLFTAILSMATPVLATDLVVYSSRAAHLIEPLTKRYEEKTGNKITLVSGEAGALMERLRSEGSNTAADVFITVDGGNLWQASQMGLLQPIQSKTLTDNIPKHLRDPKNQWFGLSIRARTIMYNPTKVKPSQLSTYADLADPKWKGKLCLRTSNSVYNKSLVGTMMAHEGEAQTENIVKGWVANLAIPPVSNDNEVLKAIDSGRCDVGITNTYYYGRMVAKEPNLKVKVFFANQNGRGTHVNVSGAGVTKHSKNAEEAQKFIEWLSGSEAQNLFVDNNREFPANPKIAPHKDVAAWGKFKQDVINVSIAGANQTKAVMLMKKAGFK